jgi:hypothetical protein
MVTGQALAPQRLENGTTARQAPSSAALDIEALVGGYESVGLEAAASAALMRRTDTKFLLSLEEAGAALAALAGDYFVLEVAGRRVRRYRSLYFDTEDLALYRQHHAGRPFRAKVRSREYVETRQPFLELKRRTKRGVTLKERRPTPALLTSIDGAAGGMLSGLPGGALSLRPVLWNSFSRITLVGRGRRERVTLDLDLCFRGGGRDAALPGVAVAEVKTEGAGRESPFRRRMRELGVRPTAFSKYCVGVVLLLEGAPRNRFKPVMLRIARIARGEHDVQGAV